jgi:molybdate transport system substrate-binding protein
MVRRLWWPLCLIAALASISLPVRAAELQVFATGATRHTLTELAPEFTRATGIAVSFAFGTAGEIQRKAAAGEPADLVIVPVPRLEALMQSGTVAAASRVDIARAALALAVRDTASAPDISSIEAFTRVLIGARSVAFTDPAAGGTAGIYFAELLQRLGIAETIRPKAVLARGGRDAAERVARDEAELAITFVSEILPVKGVRVAGLLPEALQHYTIYSAGVPVKSAQTDAARAFVKFITSPATAGRWRAAGLDAMGAN